ncbi:cytochrome c oxidase subunit 3 [Rhizobium sp. WSM1325]|uniref:Cytochrome c oxidase subunit III n=1 Tax=Rhizobium leguminosarum bv. trifolii (strain WSM1325) TaxID=395491 RepID=C6B8H6_RHILS|nr:cytochrome c oxidase subunit 3 [Rhizobium leguminosarum]ACS60708.1 cytochrome c oxidase subunit III [Rhizobium leguminosarum bv. trifolii WSM1325]RWY67676.1 cytochrome c oxidase subunit III [Rhizobium leguminosarum]
MTEITRVRVPYDDPNRQVEAVMMGVYIFIGTETLLFGGIFLTIAWLRLEHPEQVVVASKTMHWLLAGVNTAVLLTSSAAMAMAVECAKRGREKRTAWFVALAAILGLGFLGLKAYEYRVEYQEGLLPVSGSGAALTEPSHRLFMDLYLISTGLHAVHLSLGLLIMAGILIGTLSQKLALPQRSIIMVVCGIYWHFVDVVWIFLYPLLYLAR